ncbi:hypothetical protein MCOR29_004881 [Pyricularia oryzae]|nr:hypothetical protein MCOR29_004881 [Pyricularia oryzae]KAI6639060.1 hypothetical protein MCOR08_002300 [Pyricularia oryzae]
MPKEDTTIAAAFPPPGVSPDFAHPRDVLHTVNIVTQVVSMVLITPLVALRMFVRVYASPPFLNEDYVCMVAWVLSMAYNITSLLSRFTLPAVTQPGTKLTFHNSFKVYKFGGGYHLWEIGDQDYRGFLKARPPSSPLAAFVALYADTIIYSLATYFTKVALLLVIARVFNDFRKTHFITIFFVVAMVFYYVPMLFLKIHVCSPISDFWTTNVQDSIPNCLDRFSIFVADTIISVITDTAVLVIPIPAVLHLRIPMRARFKVWSMLGLGGVATGASITRLVILFRTIRHSTDQTVDFYRGNQHWAHLRVPSCSQHPFQQGQAAQAASIGLQRSEYLHQEAQVPPRKPPADRDRYVRRDEEARAGQELQGDCYGGTGSCLAAVSNTYT